MILINIATVALTVFFFSFVGWAVLRVPGENYPMLVWWLAFWAAVYLFCMWKNEKDMERWRKRMFGEEE